MYYEDKKKSYDEDLKKYGYVKQSTINKFSSQEECQELNTKKSKQESVYLQRLRDDIVEYWFITNDTVNAIIWYIPTKPKKRKKKVVKIKKEQIKKHHRDSYIYHRIFERHYWDIKYCMICWSSDKLQIHHKDKNHKNNDISNLIMLCYKCHCIAHKWDRVYKLMIKNANKK